MNNGVLTPASFRSSVRLSLLSRLSRLSLVFAACLSAAAAVLKSKAFLLLIKHEHSEGVSEGVGW